VLSADISTTTSTATDLAEDIARAGFGRLEEALFDTIMSADKGIVDVYWVRKSDVSDEITRLAKERGMRRKELEARFNLISQKLEE